MTESEAFYPPRLSGTQMDAFLAIGWYRMGQAFFTTDAIMHKEEIFKVFWLRYNLQKVGPEKKSNAKIIENNSRFEATIQPLEVTEEMDNLYELYKAGINFEGAASIEQWLYEGKPRNVFDSYSVTVRDNGTLIAVGIFDKGKKAIAGILNFYNPLYKKYSPGKYLMLLKIKYAQQDNIKWYYPGYIVPGYPKFDYKLFVDKLAAEIYIPKAKAWKGYNEMLVKTLTGC